MLLARAGGSRAIRSSRPRTFPKWSAELRRPAPKWARCFIRRRCENVVPVSSTQVAEMVKLLENTFRMINIGLVNEIAMMCDRMGINVWEVIDAAATKPFGFMPFYPGPGLGGHCIPIDPFYLSWKTKQAGIEARFIELAGYINGQMPHFVVDKMQNALNDHAQAAEGLAQSTSWAWPTSATSTMCANRRRSISCTCCTQRGRKCDLFGSFCAVVVD